MSRTPAAAAWLAAALVAAAAGAAAAALASDRSTTTTDVRIFEIPRAPARVQHPVAPAGDARPPSEPLRPRGKPLVDP